MAMMRKQGRRKGWARTTNCKTSPAAIERALRIAEACRLRARGLSFPTIARAMGILKNERDKVYALVPAKPSRLREV
jgi:hypothetical protein